MANSGRLEAALLLLLLFGCGLTSCQKKQQPDVSGYYLYTAMNSTHPQRLLTDNGKSVRQSAFDRKRPTKIIIHGWTKSYTQIPNVELRSAYLSLGDHNIISVDWSEIAALSYLEAKARAPTVGDSCADFVRFLANQFKLDVSELVIIGHSMGAHIAGICGKQLQARSSGRLRLGAIVALDAAFPLYLMAFKELRVARSDAIYVMSLHTNGLLKGHLLPLGHIDFYANNGRVQPGCGEDSQGSCAHARCVHLYAEAVRGSTRYTPYRQCKDFVELLTTNGTCSQALKSLARLGDPMLVPHVQGMFTFVTTAQSPFGHK